MKFSLFACALLVASSASFCQEAGKERPKAKDDETLTIVRSKNILSYTDDNGQTISELTKPTIELFRVDNKGGKIKGTTFAGDSGTTESQPGEGLRKLTLKGNVRAEEPNGTVTTADEAVIDLVKGIYTYIGRSIRIVISEK
jgi:hypothetical protein